MLDLSKFASRLQKASKPLKGWIGCDIGSSSARFAQLRSGKNGLRIGTRWIAQLASAEVETGEMDGRADLRMLKTLGNLSELFDELNVAATLPMHLAHCRSIEIAMEQLEHIENKIAEELASELSVESSKLAFGFWRMANRGNTVEGGIAEEGSTQTYDCLSIASDVAHELGMRLLQIGLDCRAIVPFPCLIANAIRLAKGWAPPPFAVQPNLVANFGAIAESPITAGLHLGEESATFVIEVDGCPAFTRHLRSIRYRDLVQQMMELCGLSEGPSKQLIANCGLPLDDPSVSVASGVSRQVLLFAESIAAELHRTLKYIQQSDRKLYPRSIILLGEGALIQNLPKWLSTHMNLGVRSWSLPSESSADDALFAIAAALSAAKWEVAS